MWWISVCHGFTTVLSSNCRADLSSKPDASASVEVRRSRLAGESVRSGTLAAGVKTVRQQAGSDKGQSPRGRRRAPAIPPCQALDAAPAGFFIAIYKMALVASVSTLTDLGDQAEDEYNNN
jgi:hypothetical protein